MPSSIVDYLPLVLMVGALLTLAFAYVALEEFSKALRRVGYLTWSFLGIEVGIGGIVRLVLYSAFPALVAGFQKGMGNDKSFHWDVFLTVFLAITASGILVNLVGASTNLKKVLSPGAGWMFRDDRKVATSAILKAISLRIRAGKRPIPASDAVKLIVDLLDIVVLHVRDHRGNFSKDNPIVFANVLIDQGVDLVVIARDSMSSDQKYARATPARHAKAALACGRAIVSGKPITVGRLRDEYPEGPQNKPYESILAIPLVATGTEAIYGALSIDSSRPYFFESFQAGAVANDLENSLQPYIQLLTLVLEQLVSDDPMQVVPLLYKSSQVLE